MIDDLPLVWYETINFKEAYSHGKSNKKLNFKTVMAKKKITIKDLAKIMGISVSTVSKALNDSYEISEKTKIKVRAYAKKYNYKPNKLAVNLKSGKTKNIGVIIPNVLNTFFTRVLYGIERITDEKNYNIITCLSRESHQKEIDNIEWLSNGSVDGLIVAIAEETEIKGDFKHIEDAISHGIPVVLYDRVNNAITCDKVVVDDVNNAYFATKHLIDINCKHIALVSSINFLSVGKNRAEGYKKAIREAFRKIKSKLIVEAGTDDLERKISTLLENEKVDGIFAIDEDAALAVLKIVKSKGYKIPHDIAVIGYANEKLANNLTPTLTTVNQHGITMGKSAASILMDRINNLKKDYFTEIIETSIEQRGSTLK
ncbi:MAG: LacI family transcriptional regulator [Flavobacteriaceae bacterium]|nr:LacI family transcriptional regulator [Flavobacteriaceae bacterium]